MTGCDNANISEVSSSTTTAKVEIMVPIEQSLNLNANLSRIDLLANHKLLYLVDHTDPTIEQSSSETLDMRYYIYDTSTKETVELGQMLWNVASNDNAVYMENGKAYLSFDDYENNNPTWIKLVEIDMQSNTMADPLLVMEADNPLSNLAKISDTEFIYNVGKGTDIRNFTLYIYNTQTNSNTPFLTMQYDPEQDEGKIPQRARRVGDEIYVLVNVNENQEQSNVLERYSLDGSFVGAIPLPEKLSPYVDDRDGETYRISDFQVRGDQYYFYSDGTDDAFYYTRKGDEFIEASSPEYGWGILYPESDPRYLIETDLYENSRMFVTDLETEKTTECHFNIDSEYNSIYRLQMDHSGQTDQIALICATTNPDPQKAFTPQYQAYFMNFSDILSAMQQAES